MNLEDKLVEIRFILTGALTTKDWESVEIAYKCLSDIIKRGV